MKTFSLIIVLAALAFALPAQEVSPGSAVLTNGLPVALTNAVPLNPGHAEKDEQDIESPQFFLRQIHIYQRSADGLYQIIIGDPGHDHIIQGRYKGQSLDPQPSLEAARITRTNLAIIAADACRLDGQHKLKADGETKARLAAPAYQLIE